MSDLNANSARDSLAESLRGMTPSAGHLKRDQIVFAAGREKGRRETMSWVYLIGCFSCLAIGAILWVATQDHATPMSIISTPTVAPPVVTQASPMEVVETVDAAGAPTSVQDYTVHQALELRRKILTDGIDSMPALQPIPTQTVHIDPLDELLPDEPAPRSPGSGAYYLFPPR